MYGAKIGIALFSAAEKWCARDYKFIADGRAYLHYRARGRGAINNYPPGAHRIVYIYTHLKSVAIRKSKDARSGGEMNNV